MKKIFSWKKDKKDKKNRKPLLVKQFKGSRLWRRFIVTNENSKRFWRFMANEVSPKTIQLETTTEELGNDFKRKA